MKRLTDMQVRHQQQGRARIKEAASLAGNIAGSNPKIATNRGSFFTPRFWYTRAFIDTYLDPRKMIVTPHQTLI